MKLKNGLLALGAFLVVATGSGVARADYVCSVGLRPGSGGMGSEGYLYFSLYSGPDCSGDFKSGNYFCTGGATSSLCANSVTYKYERHSLLAAYRSALDALIHNAYVYLGTSTCYVGGSGCAAYLSIYSD